MRIHIQAFGFVTLILDPPDPPGNVQYEWTKIGQVTFSWDRPACGQRYGDIKYEYGYKLQDTGNLKRSNTSAPEANISGLSGDLYFFCVRAYNNEGPGLYSEIYNASLMSTSSTHVASTASTSRQEKGRNLTELLFYKDRLMC